MTQTYTIFHFPDGTEERFPGEQEPGVGRLKVVDTWIKGNETHFEMAEKTAEDYLTDDEE